MSDVDWISIEEGVRSFFVTEAELLSLIATEKIDHKIVLISGVEHVRIMEHQLGRMYPRRSPERRVRQTLKGIALSAIAGAAGALLTDLIETLKKAWRYFAGPKPKEETSVLGYSEFPKSAKALAAAVVVGALIFLGTRLEEQEETSVFLILDGAPASSIPNASSELALLVRPLLDDGGLLTIGLLTSSSDAPLHIQTTIRFSTLESDSSSRATTEAIEEFIRRSKTLGVQTARSPLLEAIWASRSLVGTDYSECVIFFISDFWHGDRRYPPVHFDHNLNLEYGFGPLRQPDSSNCEIVLVPASARLEELQGDTLVDRVKWFVGFFESRGMSVKVIDDFS